MKGKVALVTGGASGIGRATALIFAMRGAKVAVSDVDENGLAETVKLIEKEGGEALSIVCDISEEDEVKKMIRSVIDEFGQLDMACNNAGIEGKLERTADYKTEDWDRVLNINLRGQWLCMKYELPELIKSKGSIVNVSSILGKVGFANAAAYTAAKHGLIGLTETAALEYAADGVRINAVCPGFIATPMLDRAGITTDQQARKDIEALHPLGRLGSANEIAEAIVWIASGKASFVTGHSLLVDGGYVIR